MEPQRIETQFGPVDVRLYRLRGGWWPVVVGGRDQLPADPVLEGQPLPQAAEDAVQRIADAIRSMTEG